MAADQPPAGQSHPLIPGRRGTRLQNWHSANQAAPVSPASGRYGHPGVSTSLSPGSRGPGQGKSGQERRRPKCSWVTGMMASRAQKTSQSDGCAPSACLRADGGCEEHPSLEHGENPQLCSTMVVWEPAPQLTEGAWPLKVAHKYFKTVVISPAVGGDAPLPFICILQACSAPSNGQAECLHAGLTTLHCTLGTQS